MVNGIAIGESSIENHVRDDSAWRFVNVPDHDPTAGQTTAKDKKGHKYKRDGVPV